MKSRERVHFRNEVTFEQNPEKGTGRNLKLGRTDGLGRDRKVRGGREWGQRLRVGSVYVHWKAEDSLKKMGGHWEVSLSVMSSEI